MELNLNRIINLIKRDIVMHWKIYLPMTLMITATYAFNLPITFGTYWMIFALILTFKEYTNPTNLRVQIITLPASNIEKHLYSFFITFVFFPLIIISSMTIGLLLGYLFDGIVIGNGFSQALNLFPYTWEMIIKQSLIYIPLISILFFGNIYFNKQGGVKISGFIIAFLFVVMMIDAYILKLITGESGYSFVSRPNMESFEYIKYIASVGTTAFFLFLSYLSLTEKEV
ncbi:MAG: hypothetical protein WCR29_07510 [Bacteroidales bacterium]